MEQTAIEWLLGTLEQNDIIDLDSVDNNKYYDIINKAKEMEKQQIIDACNQEECFGSSGYGIHEDITKGEEYYNVTFKNK
jgi:hypothetical protein